MNKNLLLLTLSLILLLCGCKEETKSSPSNGGGLFSKTYPAPVGVKSEDFFNYTDADADAMIEKANQTILLSEEFWKLKNPQERYDWLTRHETFFDSPSKIQRHKELGYTISTIDPMFYRPEGADVEIVYHKVEKDSDSATGRLALFFTMKVNNYEKFGVPHSFTGKVTLRNEDGYFMIGDNWQDATHKFWNFDKKLVNVAFPQK